MAKLNDMPDFFSVKVFLTNKSDSHACRQQLKTRSNNRHPRRPPAHSRPQQAANYLLTQTKGGQCYV
ncbi:hypothetical protein SG34_030605 [Thalassomonas viridans]|uniref:Uncharacterized protein n=1 Tax=Thalassomonas viridans TaxID=137584 RepID=A0AAF0CEB0_9GAMM|nr:hypothetical protein [Thalassomonas viridans]WDE09120.1 hypothetical protein SG34_030605 [Thalassomonas viridans]